VWPPAPALVVVFFPPRVLLLLAAASAPLLFVVFPLGVDVRPRFVVSASRALSLPGIDAVRLPLTVLALGVERPAVVSAPRAHHLSLVDAVQLLLVPPLPVNIGLAVVSPPRAAVMIWPPTRRSVRRSTLALTVICGAHCRAPDSAKHQ
jgi:hypothetical protein